MKINIGDRIIYWTVLAIVFVVRLLPLSICFAMGQVIGAFAWSILPGYRRLTRQNMVRAFGNKYSSAQIHRMVFKHFILTGANFLSALKIPALKEREIHKCCEVENKDFIISALARGKGVVLAISHMGNWELCAQLSFHLPKVSTGAIYQSLKNKKLNALIDKDRRSRGLITFDRKKGFMRAITMLRQGGVLGVLVDQHAGDSGLWTPFFSRLSSTSPLPAILACKSDAEVIPVAIFTTGFARWKVSIRPPLSYAATNPDQLTADINTSLESQIRESPLDWFWLHNRWKTPDPRILLSKEKRGIYLPKNAELHPFPILIRSSNWLGDAVLSIPTVQAIKRGRVDARISVLTQEKLADLWRAIPEVDEVITISGSPWNTAQKLRGRFEAAILLPNSLRSALEVFLAGIPRRIGYRGHNRAWLLNQIIPELKQPLGSLPKHHAERFAHIAIELGAPNPQFQPLNILSSPSNNSTPSSSPSNSTPSLLSLDIGLCPGAEYGPAKRWPAQNYRKVLEEVSQQMKCRWKIFGTTQDQPLAKEIMSGLPENNVIDRTGKTSLAELMSELSSLSLLLTNDTGTMHLAALLGVPIVAIFGSTEPLLTSPFGSKNWILRYQVECSPCFLRTCPIDFRCMKAISTQQVKETILAIIN